MYIRHVDEWPVYKPCKLNYGATNYNVVMDKAEAASSIPT